MDKVYVIGRDAVPQYLRLEAGGRLGLTFIALPGTVARLALEVEIAGPGCDVDIAGTYVCGGEDDFRMNILVRHMSGGSSSRQLVKGLAGGSRRPRPIRRATAYCFRRKRKWRRVPSLKSMPTT